MSTTTAPTPVIDMAPALGLRGELWLKREDANPTGSVKDRPVQALLARPEVAAAETLVEASGGNTGIALAVAGRAEGKRVVVTMSRKMSAQKVTSMEQAGAQVVLCPMVGPDDPEHFIAVARRLGSRPGCLYLDQFGRDENTASHEFGTGVELLTQVPHLDAFVAGVGTGGTITGVGRALKSTDASRRVVLADPVGSILADLVEGTPPQPGPYLVEGIGGDVHPELLDLSVVDEAVRVSDAEAARLVLLLREQGIAAGGSTGLAVAAAAAWLRKHPGSSVATLVADGADRYPISWGAESWLRHVATTGTAPVTT